MRNVRSRAAVASVGMVVSALGAIGAISPTAGATTATAGRADLSGSLAPAAARGDRLRAVPAATEESFQLSLTLRNAAGAQAIARAVSDPTSASYHHYLTDAQWEATYGPTRAEVTAAVTWLRHNGFTVGAVPSDRLVVPATGTAAAVEKAFSTTLGYYKVNGRTVQLADGSLSVPSSVAASVSGVVGVNQYVATPDITQEGATAATTPPTSGEPAPPAGFRNARECSAYWGQLTDTTDKAALVKPLASPLPYDICGYKPGQLRSAYGLTSAENGKGVTIAIVDAYDSPTLLSDAQRYFATNDPSIKLTSAQFTNDEPATVDDQTLCAGSGWFTEQSLDVEASHTMAPDAHIIYVGGQDCVTGLLTGLQTAITSGASVVSDSWGDTLGDLLDDAASKTAYDNTFMLADATGVSVLFSSGDSGDNFAAYGIAAPDYPPSSPFVTAVGGTSLEVNQAGARAAEYGWSTSKSILCTSATTNCGGATSPLTKLGYDYGGGGGTSYTYTQPYYQAGVVPPALALRNQALFGRVPLRVEPDISMDADPQTGMLIGSTQTFPTGVFYSQFKEGGTSLASPLFAGVVADADQAAGASLGFLNPTLYKAYSSTPAAFNDIVKPVKPATAAAVRVDYLNSLGPVDGYVISTRGLGFEGPETYCDDTGNCATRPVTLTTKPGFDGMTGLGSISATFVKDLSGF